MSTTRADSGTPGGCWGFLEAAEAWRRDAASRAGLLGAVTEAMLDLADLRPGYRVLDLAAGTGDQAPVAARRVGPTGAVLATDIAASMLAAAAEAAREARLANVTTRVMDAQDLAPASFDAVISRFGLMFLPDLQRAGGHPPRPAARRQAGDAGLVDARAEPSLRAAGRGRPPPRGAAGPGARGAGDVRTGRAGRPGGGVPNGRLPRRDGVGGRPPPPILLRRGVRPRPAGVAGPLRELLDWVDEPDRTVIWTEIERDLRQFEEPRGFEAPGEALLVVGTKERDPSGPGDPRRRTRRTRRLGPAPGGRGPGGDRERPCASGAAPARR